MSWEQSPAQSQQKRETSVYMEMNSANSLNDLEDSFPIYTHKELSKTGSDL